MWWVWTRSVFFFFFFKQGSLFFSKASAELTWAQAVTDANSFTSTSPVALQGVCARTHMCVGLPSAGLQWIILLRRSTSCSPCRHKAWHCHSNKPPAETPSVVAVTAVPYPKESEEQVSRVREEEGRIWNWWECAKTEWRCREARETDGGKSKSVLEWQKVEERK